MRATIQTNILKPIKLKTSYSLNNCIVGEGKPSLSYSPSGVSLSETPLIFYVNSELFSPVYDWDNSFALERFAKRICFGKEKVKVKKVCKSCGSDFELDSDGKPICYIYSCNSPYCRDPVCMKHRQFLAYKMFMMYFTAYDTWKGRGDRWGHEGYGFVRTSEPMREDIADMKIQIRKFQAARVKKFNVRIKGIGVRDIAYDVEKIGEEYFIHFHFARRPTRFIKKSELNKLAEHYGFKYNWFGYREARWLADYFAKRHSGQFEHEDQGNNWLFADLFSIKDYFKIFYGARKTLQFGFSRKEIKMLKWKYEEFLKRKAFELSSIPLDVAVRNTCQNCYYPEFKIVRVEEHIINPPDPPPDPLKIIVERVSA